jgi:sortase (surface protein transpeptidase)
MPANHRGHGFLAVSVTMLAVGVAAGVVGVFGLVHPGRAGAPAAVRMPAAAFAGAAAGGGHAGAVAVGGAAGAGAAGGGAAGKAPGAGSGAEAGIRSSGWAAINPGKPISIEIPSIGVRSRLVRLGLQADGSLQAPPDWDTPGWYGDGSTPGQVDSNPAVIAGHVDSRTGPAVFYRLRDLKPGDQVIVRRDDGVVARFTVDGSRSFAKTAFPDAEVYGAVDTVTPQLRLITCTGSFDRKAGRYRDDLVVFAHRTG